MLRAFHRSLLPRDTSLGGDALEQRRCLIFTSLVTESQEPPSACVGPRSGRPGQPSTSSDGGWHGAATGDPVGGDAVTQATSRPGRAAASRGS